MIIEKIVDLGGNYKMNRTVKAILIWGVFCLTCLGFSDTAWAMHISEGILPLPWAGLWTALALPFVIWGGWILSRNSDTTYRMTVAMVGAVVFLVSCMPIPVPTAGTCSHPCGTGISAILIGPVMSIFVTSIALFLQAMFMAHGGLTTWGADITSMGIMGSFAGILAFRGLRAVRAPLFWAGFAAGFAADWATYITTSLELSSALHGSQAFGAAFMAILTAFVPTQLPLSILEGFMTGGALMLVAQKRPDILVYFGVLEAEPTLNS